MAAERRRRAGPLRAVLLALLLGGCATAPGQVELAGGEGGDAWTFHKLLTAQVAGDCEAVRFAAPLATVEVPVTGGLAMAEVPLRTGSNPVTAACLPHGGSDSQTWELRLAEGPTAAVRTVPKNGGMILDAGASRVSKARPAPLTGFQWRARPGNPAPLAGLPAQGRRVTLAPPPRDGEYFVALTVSDAAGRSDTSTAVFRVAGGRAEAVDLARDNPAWVDEAVVYGVAPFFFGERRLADVTARLDALAALGVNTLWLSPVTASAEGDFGYAVTDTFALREDFGSEAELRALIEGAHARGLRVIMDFVPNHVAEQHPYYEDAQADGISSPYFSYFERNAAGEALHYFDWTNLINLNLDNPEVQRWVIEGFLHWVRAYDVDGFRADAAWGPRLRAPEFWSRWRAALKREKPDLLLLAEASARDPYYAANGFDAAYDWTEELGVWAWRDAFDRDWQTAALLRQAIAASLAPDDDDNPVFRFLNNNDTGERFFARYGLARTKLAAVLLLTLPGLPMIYTGQEVGALFEPYDEGPVLAWADPRGLRPWYRKLVALRAAQPALRSGELQFLPMAPANRVLAYLRPGAPDVLVLQNWGPGPLEVSMPRNLAARLKGGAMDLLTGASLSGDAAMTLPGYGARIIALPP